MGIDHFPALGLQGASVFGEAVVSGLDRLLVLSSQILDLGLQGLLRLPKLGEPGPGMLRFLLETLLDLALRRAGLLTGGGESGSDPLELDVGEVQGLSRLLARTIAIRQALLGPRPFAIGLGTRDLDVCDLPAQPLLVRGQMRLDMDQIEPDPVEGR